MNLGSKSEQVIYRVRVHSVVLTTIQETSQILLSIVPIGGTSELIVEDALAV